MGLILCRSILINPFYYKKRCRLYKLGFNLSKGGKVIEIFLPGTEKTVSNGPIYKLLYLTSLYFLCWGGRFHSLSGLLLETLAFLWGRPNKGLKTQLWDYWEQLNITFCFQKRRKNRLPLLPPFALMAWRPHFQLFFCLSWLSLWSGKANMPERSSPSG